MAIDSNFILNAINTGRASARASAANRRQQEEHDYTMGRREVTDPYRDRELERRENAIQAMIEQYGPAAGAPQEYATNQRTDAAAQMLPGELEQQAIMNETRKFALEQNLDAKALNEFGTVADQMLAQIDAGTPPEQAYMAIPEPIRRTLDFTEQDATELVNAYLQNPNAVKAMTQMWRDPAKVQQIFKAQGENGPEFFAFRSDGTAQGTGVAPYEPPPEPPTDLDRARAEYYRAQAARAYSQARGSGSGSGSSSDQGTPPGSRVMNEEDLEAFNGYRLFAQQLAQHRDNLVRADELRAIPSSKNDMITNVLTGDNPVGRFIGDLTGSEKEEARKNLDVSVSKLMTTFMQQNDLGARMFDTQPEKEYWQSPLGVTGTVESRIKAVDVVMDEVEARLEMLLGNPGPGTVTRVGHPRYGPLVFVPEGQRAPTLAELGITRDDLNIPEGEEVPAQEQPARPKAEQSGEERKTYMLPGGIRVER